MSHTNVKRRNPMTRIFFAAIAAILLLPVAAHAAVPGISGSTFSLSAHDGYSTQPDGAQIYSWGYSCAGANPAPTFVPFPGNCPVMQIPGPTLFVNEGQVITVKRIPGDWQRRHCGLVSAGGNHRSDRHLHVHSYNPGHARVLQRNAR